MLSTKKKVLDPCCGSKKFYFDKEAPCVLFGDIRDETYIQVDGRRLEVKPDVQLDFTRLPFDDESFALVVFDPPHLRKAGETSFVAQSYGTLPQNEDPAAFIGKGFKECWRVLKKEGTLIFKWNNNQIPLHTILKSFGVRPLFGNRRPTGKTGSTYWMVFFKSN